MLEYLIIRISTKHTWNNEIRLLVDFNRVMGASTIDNYAVYSRDIRADCWLLENAEKLTK